MTREMMITEVIRRYGFEADETISFCQTVEIYEAYTGFIADLMLRTLFNALMEKNLEED